MTKILLMLTMTQERCCSWFGSRVQELSCSDIAGSADNSDDDGDVELLTTMMLTTMMMTMRMVPKERCRCSRAGSRVNKLSCSDIHESSGEHLSRPFSLEMTMMSCG